jgi:hypothetical protein
MIKRITAPMAIRATRRPTHLAPGEHAGGCVVE